MVLIGIHGERIYKDGDVTARVVELYRQGNTFNHIRKVIVREFKGEIICTKTIKRILAANDITLDSE